MGMRGVSWNETVVNWIEGNLLEEGWNESVLDWKKMEWAGSGLE